MKLLTSISYYAYLTKLICDYMEEPSKAKEEKIIILMDKLKYDMYQLKTAYEYDPALRDILDNWVF